MKINSELEKELMTYLKELTEYEGQGLQVFSAMYVNLSEKIKEEKITSFKNAISNQIKFYGRKDDDYATDINSFTESYNGMIQQILDEYNTRFVSVASELQDTWNNQKIAIVNEKISIEQENEVNQFASENRRNNYEIIIQECTRQLEECKQDMENKLNEIFYDKDKALSLGKTGFFQKIIYFFTGDFKIKSSLDALKVELGNQKEMVQDEIQKINEETVRNIAIIKDGQMQAQKIFEDMLEV